MQRWVLKSPILRKAIVRSASQFHGRTQTLLQPQTSASFVCLKNKSKFLALMTFLETI